MPRLRIVAVAFGLVGLIIMLWADGGVPIPQGLGEWMSLAGGVIWSFSTTGIRAKSNIEPVTSAFIFACGAAIVAIVLAPMLQPFPSIAFDDAGWAIGLAAISGLLWWGISLAALMWATVRLDPARVSILLMTEVVVGAATAALFANESLHALEIAGGAMVISAGVLEVWPTRPIAASQSQA
jgi:drug/metabolite transporter (DMT)-like permease